MSATNFHAAVFVNAEVPAPETFHPEFGYLCPSARLRRKLRRIVVTVGTGMAIAAGTALGLSAALVPHVPGQGTGEEAMLPVIAAVRPVDQAADQLATNRSTSAAMTPAIPFTAATDRSPVTDRSAPLRAGSCDDLAASFLMPGCQFGKSSKARMARASRAAHSASHRVATLPIDRGDTTPVAEQDRTAAVAVATNEAPPAPPAEKPAMAAKKRITTAQKQAPTRNAGAETVTAAAPGPEFGFFGFLHGLPRSGIGPGTLSFRAP
jgi:hypothetical protein